MNEHPVNEPYKPNARETRIQIIKFALFSASAGIIETAAFTVLDMVTPWKYWPCYLIALVPDCPGTLGAVELHAEPRIHL